MKKSKLVLFSALFIAAVSFQSCKKTYQCVCQYPDGTTETTELEGSSLSDLQDDCIDICL